MSEKIRAVVKRRSHSRSENGRLVTYKEGETLMATESEMKAFSDRLEESRRPEPKPKREPTPPAPPASGNE